MDVAGVYHSLAKHEAFFSAAFSSGLLCRGVSTERDEVQEDSDAEEEGEEEEEAQ